MISILTKSTLRLSLLMGIIMLPIKSILWGQTQAEPKWTLTEIIQLGLDNSLQTKQAVYNYQDAQWSFHQSQSLFKPWVDLEGNLPNYTRTVQEIVQPDGSLEFQSIQYNNSAMGMSLSQEIVATGGRLFINSDLQRFDNFASEKRNYNGLPIRIGLEQPLFQFNALKWTKKMAPIQRDHASKEYLTQLEIFSTDIVAEYFKALNIQLDYQIAKLNQENNDTLYQIALERFNLGKISQNDLLQLQRESIQAKKEFTSTQVELSNARERLAAFLGTWLPLEGTFNLPERPILTDIDYNLAIEKARTNRPEKLYYLLKQMEADRDLELAKKSNSFQANVLASAGLIRSANNLSEIYSDPQNEQALSLQLRIPITHWGYNKASIKRQEIQRQYTENEIVQLDRNFQLEVTLVCRTLEKSVAELEYASQLNDIAQERYTISKNRYLYGDISITDLTLALREKDSALREYVRALQSAWLNYYKLRALTLYDFIKNQDIDHLIPNYN